MLEDEANRTETREARAQKLERQVQHCKASGSWIKGKKPCQKARIHGKDYLDQYVGRIRII